MAEETAKVEAVEVEGDVVESEELMTPPDFQVPEQLKVIRQATVRLDEKERIHVNYTDGMTMLELRALLQAGFNATLPQNQK